ncbi:hypothetical protein OG800_50570 (plasmid) [Streptomyces sp. NBC_00445]|uniref:hypothetical protein n=1 Tax=Streptomyces sp. NBC_00445 TaxID=2975745 RepID=UPI002E1B5C2E
MEKGDILSRRSLQEYAFSAHQHVMEAGRSLEAYRRHLRDSDLDAAEESTDLAIADFGSGTGETDAAAWAVAVPYMVQFRALFHCADRLTTHFDPVPAPPSMFTPSSPLRLDKITYQGHQQVLDAARWLDLARREPDRMHVARAQHATYEAAALVCDQLPGLSLPLWILVSRYCAELHAENLLVRTTHGTTTAHTA